MLMRLDLALITEAAGPTVTGGVVATVVIEVVDPGEEDSEGIKLPLHPFLPKTHKIYSLLPRAISLGVSDKQWAKPDPIAKEGWAI